MKAPQHGASTEKAKTKIERQVLTLCIKQAKRWAQKYGEQKPYGHPQATLGKDAWLLVHLSLKLLNMKRGKR